MKQKGKIRLLLCAFVTAALLAGCGSQSAPEQSRTPTPPVSTDTLTPSTPKPAEPPVQGQTATIYVGTKAGGFAEYPLEYEEELTPEILIQSIADLTGWDLTLAEEVTSGKGGMSVCLANTSSLFSGPPESQRDEFHMFSAEQLAETILDSIQKTLQEGFTGEDGDPDALDIWYYAEDNQPLELPDIGRSWPIDQPYQWVAGE
ncbi:MAG: hypothetical protein K2O18_16220 [Oscillospiraceae bacterium]|nr:hypothetical protein [Oscillospiraceae bacterium]